MFLALQRTRMMLQDISAFLIHSCYCYKRRVRCVVVLLLLLLLLGRTYLAPATTLGGIHVQPSMMRVAVKVATITFLHYFQAPRHQPALEHT